MFSFTITTIHTHHHIFLAPPCILKPLPPSAVTKTGTNNMSGIVCAPSRYVFFFLHLICLSNPSILAFLIMILVILALLNLSFYSFFAMLLFVVLAI